MPYYVKLFNNVPEISATYKDVSGADQTVVIAGGGAITAVPLAVLQLPGVVAAKTANNLKVYSDSAATTEITSLPTSDVVLPGAATTTVAGLVKKLPAQANSTATDVPGLLADFNALLAKLRTAGILS